MQQRLLDFDVANNATMKDIPVTLQLH